MRRTLILAMLLGGMATAPLAAQDQNIGGRVDKLEKEMRAVQRKVFPGGKGLTVEPQITAPASTTTPTGSPSNSPFIDLTSRVSALESQLQQLTSQSEQNSYKIKQIEDAFAKYRADMDARVKALENTSTPSGSDTPIVAVTKTPATKSAPETAPKLSTARKTELGAIERPSTGDAGDDAYTYGYRLWEAKFYPEAQAQLKATVTKYPKHKQISFAQNLLGRAYYDDGKPALASVAFYDNYKKNPKGERASTSLYYLGQSLYKLKKLPDACKVYDEFNMIYGTTASASLKAQVAKGRAEAKCK